MAEPSRPVTPLTALVVNADGQLTYMGQDGQRYVIVGHSEVLDAWNQAKDQDIDHNNGS